MSCLPLPRPVAADPLPMYDPLSGMLHSVIAGELREMRDMIEALAGVLAGDEHLVARFLEQLQSFDYLIQHIDECVILLERLAAGEDSLGAIAHVRLGAVQERLRTALECC